MKEHNLNIEDFELDEIVEIEFLGEQETVDIMVEDTHMFYANDIYTHNSYAEEEIITMEGIAEAYAKNNPCDLVLSLSRTNKDKNIGTARIFIGKNRNGPDGILFPAFLNTAQSKLHVLAPTDADFDVEEHNAKAKDVLFAKAAEKILNQQKGEK